MTTIEKVNNRISQLETAYINASMTDTKQRNYINEQIGKLETVKELMENGYNFAELLNNSYEGRFGVEIKKGRYRIEINVSFAAMNIVVTYFPANIETLDDISEMRETYVSLTGMFGRPSVEKKFYQILNKIKNS